MSRRSSTSSQRGRGSTAFTPLPVSQQGPPSYVTSIFGLYFGLENARPEGRFFRAKTVELPDSGSIKHTVKFDSVFGAEFRDERIFTALVVLEGRRYVVAGPYKAALDDYNMAIHGIGCRGEYKGDLAIFFLPVFDRRRFLAGVPRYRTSADRQDVLEKVVSVFTNNVHQHVEHGGPLKRLLRA